MLQSDTLINGTQDIEKNGSGEETRIKIISNHFRRIIQALGLDPDSNNLKDTPRRIATLYVNDIFSGLNEANKPELLLSENKNHYSEMVVEKNITLCSYCELYFTPFTAKVQVAYIPKRKTIASVQLQQLLQYHGKKPQSKEKLIEEIAVSLKDCLATQDVAVIVEAIHCHTAYPGDSSTITNHFSGKFQNEDTKRELFAYLK